MKSCFIAFRILWKEALRYAYDEPFLLRISNSIKSEKFWQNFCTWNYSVVITYLNKPAIFSMYVWSFSGHQALKG